jgi:hypothetical protein
MSLRLEWQYAIIDWTDFDTLRHVKIAFTFGAGFFVYLENNSTFRDRIGWAHGFAVAT